METTDIVNQTDSSENNAQEKLRLRREARQKKILENAKNRLDKLNGRTSNELATRNLGIKDEADPAQFSDPEVEPDLTPGELNFEQTPAIRNNNFNFQEFLSTSDLGAESARPLKSQHFAFRSRMHIILSAVITCLISLLTADSGHSIFILVGASIVVELLFFRPQQQLNPIISVVISLCGMRPEIASKVLHLLSIVHSLVLDVGVFMFSFCMITFLMNSVNEKFADVAQIK